MASVRAQAFLEGYEPFVCAEIGSCHLGSLSKLYELTDECIKAGANGVKLQLFPNDQKYTKANHYLKPQYFEEWVRKYSKKIHLGVTVFETRYPSQEIMNQLSFVKVARSWAMDADTIALAKKQQELNPHLLLVGSFGYMDLFSKQRFEYDIALYCHTVNGQTVYPVEYMLEYDAIVKNGRIDGLSDHSLYTGIELAEDTTIIWLEKHVMLNGQLRSSCGDAAFALEMKDFKTYVETAKNG